MTSLGETLSPATSTKPVSKWLGRSVFEPNASINNNLYRSLIIAEVIVALLLWCLMPAIIPSPLEIYRTTVDLISEQGLLVELWTSLTLSVEAILLSSVIALPLSYGASIAWIRPISNVVSKLRFVSLVGISFIMTLYVGGGHPLKLAMLTFGLLGFMVAGMKAAVLQVPVATLNYYRTLRSGKWRVLYEAQILGTLGTAFDIIQQNAAMGWVMLTMVEGIVRGEGGIGKMLLDQEKHLSLAAIFSIQFIFLLVGIGQDAFIIWLKGMVAPASMLAFTKDK